MGLTVRVNGFDAFDIGYITFTKFRLALAEKISPRARYLYDRWLFAHLEYTRKEKLNKEELAELNELTGNVGILFAHSDCDGNFSPSESRKLYLALKDIELDFDVEGYCCQSRFNVLKRFKDMFYFSWKNRRKVIFS